MLKPGRPSGLSAVGITRSIAASMSQPITLVALPQKEIAAVFAHSSSSAVTIRRAAVMGKASAKVSAIGTPLSSNVACDPNASRSPAEFVAAKTCECISLRLV